MDHHRMRAVGAGLTVIAAGLGACSAGSSSSQQASTPSSTVATSVTPSPSASTSVVLDGEPWIVYQLYDVELNRADLRLIRPDGTGDHALLAAPSDEQYHPDWSPDGDEIAFTMAGEIWVAGADGTAAHRVARCDSPCADLDGPAWSPDGSSIAFSRIDDLVDGQAVASLIQAVDLTTGTVATLATAVGPEYAFYPRWAPDGMRLLVELDRFDSTDNEAAQLIGSTVAIVDPAAPSPVGSPLTDWATFAAYPDWNPTMELIVFSTYDLGTRDGDGFADPSPPSDLYTIKPDGTGLTQLTHNPQGATLIRRGTASGPLSCQPTWSPDGTSIILVQVDGIDWPGWTMATIRADGTGLAPAAGAQFLRGTHPRLRPG